MMKTRQIKWLKLALCLSLSLITVNGAFATPKVKYLTKFKSNNAVCLADVNGVTVHSSLVANTGTISTGCDVSALLENGKNEISILLAPIDDNRGTLNFASPASCSFELSAVTEEDSLLLTSVTAEADKDIVINAKKSIYYNGTGLTSAVSEHKHPNYPAYEVKRTVTLKELPQWAWTKATPFEPTPENMQKLKDAYWDIWTAMDQKDLAKMKELTKIIVAEEAEQAEMEPDAYFNTYSFKRKFKESKGGLKPNFANFSLTSYCNGRLIRLENKLGHSPLKLQLTDDPDGVAYNYKPYLSLVNGKIIISR
jgi:hypothetical protein